MPLRSLLRVLTPEEIDEWQAFYEIEPWGFWSDHLHFGMLQALIFNMNRGKNTPAASASDFMPLDPRNQKRAKKKHDEAVITSFFKQAQALQKARH